MLIPKDFFDQGPFGWLFEVRLVLKQPNAGVWLLEEKVAGSILTAAGGSQNHRTCSYLFNRKYASSRTVEAGTHACT